MHVPYKPICAHLFSTFCGLNFLSFIYKTSPHKRAFICQIKLKYNFNWVVKCDLQICVSRSKIISCKRLKSTSLRISLCRSRRAFKSKLVFKKSQGLRIKARKCNYFDNSGLKPKRVSELECLTKNTMTYRVSVFLPHF